MVRVKHAWWNLSRFKLEPSLELDCRRRATVGRAVPIYRSITVVIKSNKGKRDDRFDRAAATKCHVAVLSASCTSDKTASLDITEVKYRETSRKPWQDESIKRLSYISIFHYLTTTTTTTANTLNINFISTTLEHRARAPKVLIFREFLSLRKYYASR